MRVKPLQEEIGHANCFTLDKAWGREVAAIQTGQKKLAKILIKS